MGNPYFITSSRMNLGIYQPDGVVCDLAPHDLSILMYWLNEPVIQVAASGRGMFRDEVVETAFITLTFASDSRGDESVRIYDRGFEVAQPEPANFGEYRLTYRTGDMVAPRIDAVEPLNLELQDFARAILTGDNPRSNARLGLDIVLALEAAEASLENGGAPVPVALASELMPVS